MNIALFNGSFIDVPDTEAYAVIMLKGARLRGADAALNEKVPGLLQKSLGSQASDRAQALPITSNELTGDFVLLQWMKPLKPTDSETELKARVRQALDAFIDCARDYRIASLSIVPIGVNLGLTPEDSADLILDAFLNQTADGIQNIALCEIDTGRYDKIKEHVLNRVDQAGGNLSCSELEPQIPTNLRVPLFLDFSQLPNKNRKGPQVIQQFARGTGGGGVVPKDSKTIDWSKLKDAFDANSGLPPNFAKHGEIGMELTNWVLSESVRQCVQENRSNPWEILHDLSCSDIPFEMLAFKDKDGTVSHPALHVGFCRRLASENADPVSNFAAKGCYRLLLVANPTDDLKATLKEAEQIQEELGSITLPRFEIKSLIGSRQATLSKVLDEIGTGRYDLIHYAGHGHFDSNPKKSGLKFKQGFLTAQELRDTILRRRKERRQTAARAGTTDPGRPPMLVFLNACLSSKMIGSGDTQARVQASLAEAVLEAGVAGLIGNRWQVQDNSAATFAIKIYRALTSRIALGEAIRQARQTLYDSGQPDWANYQFYGSREVII
ncbi:MAG: CHAT domain-containing protein [Verrucomicrobia bacterium]|nr:MAG: CHAT domain-containing protein [Verrucomicrobiota bacterium]